MRKRSRLYSALGGTRGIQTGAILILTLIAYAPSLSNGFIWDDDDYVINNLALRDLQGLKRIWCERGAVPQYYPMTHTTFWVEYHIWGDAPLGYHLINILLHAANAVMVWLILKRLKVPGAFVAGVIFAVHPMMAESVAWITERKNVLSGLLCLLSLHFYLRYAVMRERNWAGAWRVYGLALGLFIAALLSKTIVATLPAVILVLTWWKRGSIRLRDVLPVVPFFIMGIALGLNTIWMEQMVVGAQGEAFDLTLADRLLVAGRAAWFYPGQLLWPADLIFIYPRWQIDSAMWVQWLFPVTAVLLLLTLLTTRRRIGRGPLTAALIYGGMLFPAMGFFNVYPMRFSFVADHFCYLPSIALIAIISCALSRRGAVAVVIVVVLMVLTWQQTPIYQNKQTLWADTVDKNPNAVIARVNYGLTLINDGRFVAAQQQIEHGLSIDPHNAQALNAMGNVYRKQGRNDEAQVVYEQLIKEKPHLLVAKINLAFLLYERNKNNPRVRSLAEAVMQRLDPKTAPAGLPIAALANRLSPHAPEAHLLMGLVHANANQDADAMNQFVKALQLREEYPDAHYQLGLALARQNQFDRAAVHLQRTLQLNPHHPRAQKFLDLIRQQQQ